MKKVLITGGNGLLGQSVTRLLLQETEHEILVTGSGEEPAVGKLLSAYRQVDVTNKKQLRDCMQNFRPAVIVHTAANTGVDACEEDRDMAQLVNVKSVEYLAESARIFDSHIIHISSDYVFDGEKAPLDESAMPNPINYYGRTKHASENIVRGAGVRHTIIRTMILYGFGYNVKPNFALWVLGNLTAGNKISVVIDQYGQPTFVDDLAYGIIKIIDRERTGLYHLSGAEVVSRYDFAVAVAETFRLPKNLIQPITSDELLQLAPRPRYSEFVTQKARVELGIRMSNVHEGLSVLRKQIEDSRYSFA
jgi:dTDP-4-dehydrorhamnose reductase